MAIDKKISELAAHVGDLVAGDIPVAVTPGVGPVKASVARVRGLASDNTWTGNNVFSGGTGELIGSNLVTNGDFATDATGWELYDVGVWADGKVTVTYADGDYAGISQSISVEAGKSYVIDVTFSNESGDTAYVYASIAGSSLYSDDLPIGSHRFIFEASETGTATITDANGKTYIPGAVYSNVTNMGIGVDVLRGNPGVWNTALGYQALRDVTKSEFDVLAGSENTVVGAAAGRSITTARRNSVLGSGALASIQTYGCHTVIGRSAARDLITGSYNVVIGYDAMKEVVTADSNVIIGMNAAINSTLTPDSCVFIGRDSGRTENGQKTDAYNSIAIGRSACATKSN